MSKKTVLNVELDEETRANLKARAKKNGRAERREAARIIERSVNR